MMQSQVRVEKLGKHRFALGLDWKRVEKDGSVKETLGAYAPERGGFWYATSKSEASTAVGFTTHAMKGRVASFAATLASTAEDGIYVAQMDDGSVWYCVVTNHMVEPGTDRILAEHEARESVRGLQSGLDLTVYSFGDFLPGTLPFDPTSAIAKAKPVWIKRHSSAASEAVGAAALLAVGGALMFGGWKLFLAPPPPADYGLTPEEIRANYLGSVRGFLPQIPESPLWPTEALVRTRAAFPAFRAGWALEEVQCDPMHCQAAFAPVHGSPWRSAAELGGAGLSVALNAEGTAASAAIPVSVPLRDFSDEDLLYPTPPQRAAAEAVGTFGLRYVGAVVDGAPQRVSVEEMIGTQPPMDALPLIIESVFLRSDKVPEEWQVRQMTAYWAAEGFRATRIEFSHGYGAMPSAWRMELKRITTQ